ncbi:epoxide hydrolase N-terminal domain-containing protein [Kitasatospora sp. NPDC008050]|uniref:epoxide hydrolase N-terminal domain-containing protein n=1 Tax=Kitasatospora sp. NPDC008050 TaxID=3364021 RepID=UPI0036E8AF15
MVDSDAVTPFLLAVPEEAPEDLRDRLRRVRLPEAETVDGWSQGIPRSYVQQLCQY